MAIDIASLTAPLSDEAPSGPDLSYDDGRVEIEAAFDRPVSDDGGESDTDWRKIIEQILAQAGQTRDIWLPVYLMRAATFARQFDLLVDAAEMLAGLLEQRWPDVHPQLDEYGFIGRKAPCESLTRIADFLGPLARVPVLEHARFGRFCCSDIERFADQGASADGYGAFRAAIEANGPEQIATVIERFDALHTAIRRVDGVLTANAEGDTGTNFKPTYEALDRYRRALGTMLPEQNSGTVGEPAGAGEDADAMPTASGSAGSGGAAFTGSIRSREDVVRAIDAICAYFTVAEPGSPVPMLLRRARAWTGLDFMAVLEDIAPGSLDEAGRVLRSSRVPAMAGEAAAPEPWSESPAKSSSEW